MRAEQDVTFVQTYFLTAAVGKEAALEDVLLRLAAIVRALEGWEAVTLLRDESNPGRYVFMESFVDADADLLNTLN